MVKKNNIPTSDIIPIISEDYNFENISVGLLDNRICINTSSNNLDNDAVNKAFDTYIRLGQNLEKENNR